MPLFRRRLDPEHRAVLDGFGPVGEAVEAAQRALLRAVPTFRDDGLPLALALAEFGAHLDEADRALVRWQAGEDLRARCAGAIAAARQEAANLRTDSSDLVFEALNARIGDVLFPLESIVDLEAELRERRRS